MVDRNFRIHLFTSEDRIDNESGILTDMFRCGLDVLHLRKPGWCAGSVESLIDAIPSVYHKRIVFHDNPEIARKYAAGVQLNSRVSSVDFTPATLSRSCHSVGEVFRSSGLDFVTLSPVFDSISKTGYKSAFQHEELKDARFPVSVIALGGITPENVPALPEYGFDGAAMLGAVWNTVDGPALFRKFLLMRNFRLQFITDGNGIEQTLAQARQVLDGGCRWIQVRMKGADTGEVRETLQELKPICGDYEATLLVDDHTDLCGFCDGVHLGQDDMSVAEARNIVGPDKIIGLTANNSDQIKASENALPDYYGIGPFRFTSTKKNLAPVLGTDGYKKLAPLLKRPFVAIGGITHDDVRPLMSAGASGIAVSSLITRSADPVETTESIMKACSEYKKQVINQI